MLIGVHLHTKCRHALTTKTRKLLCVADSDAHLTERTRVPKALSLCNSPETGEQLVGGKIRTITLGGSSPYQLKRAEEATRTAHTSTADISGKRNTAAPQEGKFAFPSFLHCKDNYLSASGLRKKKARKHWTMRDYEGLRRRPSSESSVGQVLLATISHNFSLLLSHLLKSYFLRHWRHSTSTYCTGVYRLLRGLVKIKRRQSVTVAKVKVCAPTLFMTCLSAQSSNK